MDKAYDFKVLAEMLKVDGLEVTEETAKVINKKLFLWLAESAKVSGNPIDNIAAQFYPLIEAQIDKAAEQINPAD